MIALVSLALLLPSAAVLAQPGGPPDAADGTWTTDGAAVTGEHVSFTLTDAGLADYTVDGALVLSTLSFDPPLDPESNGTDGDTFRADGNGSLEVRDRPTGELDAETDGNLTITLADGWAAASDDEEDEAILTGPDDRTGTIHGQALSIDGATITSQQELSLQLDAPADADEDTEDDDDEDRDRSGPGAGAGPGNAGDRGQDAREQDDEDDDDDDEDRRGPPAHAQRRAFRGAFSMSDGIVEGNHVSFTLADGGLQAYSVSNQTWFTSVAFDPALDPDEIKTRGATFEAEGEDAEVKAIDNPTGHLKAEADDGTITLHLADGVNASWLGDDEDDDEERERLLLTASDGTRATVKGDNLTLTDGNRTVVAAEEIKFLVMPRGMNSQEVDDAIADGRVVAQVMVARGQGGTPEAIGIENGAVNLTTNASEGQVTLTIEGHGEGRAVLFNLEHGSVGTIEDLVIRFDGERIQPADGLNDVLTPTEGEDAEYLLIVGANTTQVLVQVPHFSVHTVQIQSAGALAPLVDAVPGSMPAFALAIVGGALFVGATYALRTRKG